jgi:phosphoglycerol transferase
MCALFASLISHPIAITIYSQKYTTYVEAKAIEAVISVEQVKTPEVDLRAFSTYYEATPIERTTSTPKNVVLIYLEGVEQTFSQEGPLNALTPQLQAIEQHAITFTNISQISEASYTIAGFVASQCGIPLMAVTHGNTLEGYQDSYLSGATCLGDILKRHGYTTLYMGGADTVFAGKGTFLRTHGFDTVYGFDELIKEYSLDESASQGWGIYDDIVFDLFRKKYDEFADQKQPFFLSLLTLDTHPPHGYISQTCKDAGIAIHDINMKNAVACTDYLVGTLVEHIMQSDAFEHTTIVIVSDHLAMNSAVSPLLNAHKRTNRFHIITAETTQTYIDTSGTTLDIGTTILPYIGFRGTIGLGQDLTIPSSQNKSHIIRTIYPSWRSEILQLWAFPTVSKGILFDPIKQQFFIDNTTYMFPAILTIDEILRTSIGFKKYLELDLFFQMLPTISQTHMTFIIDRCRMFVQAAYTDLEPTLPDNFCIGLFRGETPIAIQEFMSQVYISATELAQLKHMLYN